MQSACYRYRVVDVFTEAPLLGNPLAVFPDARGMSTDLMQKIAQELNLSETTFVFPATRPDCAANVRIFTPRYEMLFAGHPTIGTSFVLLEEAIVPKNTTHFQLEEKIGPVPIRVEPGSPPLIWLRTPPISFGALSDRAICAQALGLPVEDLLDFPPQLVTAGNPTFFIALKDKDAVDRAWIDLSGVQAIKGNYTEPVCIFVFTPTPTGAYSRMFAQEYGIIEDPATGSSTGPLAAYMMRHKLAPSASGTRFTSEQGVKMGRRSVLHVLIAGEQGSEAIEIGGHVAPLVEATMTLPSL
jgi:trans-2,3-dihydro-3-hydroxyanthranilate isomerase